MSSKIYSSGDPILLSPLKGFFDNNCLDFNANNTEKMLANFPPTLLAQPLTRPLIREKLY
jgi:hypothetical protein